MVEASTRSDSSYGTGSQQTDEKGRGELIYYILMILLILGMIVIIINIGGMLRLTLSFITLLVIGGNLVYWAIEETESLDVWKREGEFDERLNLDLVETSGTVQRAFKGMELSQGLLEKKIRNLYLSKLMDERNLSKQEVDVLLRDPEEFRRIVDDEVLSDFVLSVDDEDELEMIDQEGVEEELDSGEKFQEEEYKEWIYELLDRIERWE